MEKRSYTYEQLLEKIVRAKVRLEASRRPHHDRCMSEMDPYGADCDCGATEHNASLASALEELEL